MSEKQKIRVLGVIFILLGVVLYFIHVEIFALVMVFGGVVTFIIADKAYKDKAEDKFLDDDFTYSR